MAKQQLTREQKRLETDLTIIALVTAGVFLSYVAFGKQLMEFVKDSSISVVPRLLCNAGVQYGLAGLGITVVCLMRREKFTQFGLTGEQLLPAILGTVLCFLPSIGVIIASGQFEGYRPFHILITEDVLGSGLPWSVLGMALIAIVWGFFEGFNYVVICEKINQRYSSGKPWLDYGALICTAVCLLFHPISTSFWGIMEILTTCIAIYGMLLVKKKTGNAWGCVFAFCFIWNAI